MLRVRSTSCCRTPRSCDATYSQASVSSKACRIAASTSGWASLLPTKRSKKGIHLLEEIAFFSGDRKLEVSLNDVVTPSYLRWSELEAEVRVRRSLLSRRSPALTLPLITKFAIDSSLSVTLPTRGGRYKSEFPFSRSFLSLVSLLNGQMIVVSLLSSRSRVCSRIRVDRDAGSAARRLLQHSRTSKFTSLEITLSGISAILLWLTHKDLSWPAT